MRKIKRIILYIILVFFIGVFFFSLCHIIMWYFDNKKTDKIINELQDMVEVIPPKENITTEMLDSSKYYDVSLLSVDFTNLLQKNNDVVGWIQIPNTNVDYPFVQTKNNSYYLTHSFDKKYNDAGWLFLDYRNHLNPIDMNTIIYAHGRVDGTMFGSLKNILSDEFLDKDEYYIKISTLSYNYLFEIFSAYHIKTTDDYLDTNYKDLSKYRDYLDKIKKRSMIDFDNSVSTQNKIITLSTCYNNWEKMVVHAKLVKQEKRY